MRKLLLAMLATAALAAAQKLAGGPFVVHATPRTATIVWIVQSDQAILQAPAGLKPLISPSLRVEKTTLTGLQPNTRYDYSIPGRDSETGSFRTPPTGREPYRFVAYGDTRTRHDVHRRVVDAIVKHGAPDFIVHTGDLVADGNDSSMWPIFFDIERNLLRQTVFFPSLGNHERNSREFHDFFQVTTPYYSFDWGNSHFIILNSDIGNAASSPQAVESFWTEQTRWLEEDLRTHQQADYRFVVAHHPPFTAVTRRQGDNPHMTALVPMFERYHVSAGWFGHDHNYQHYLKSGIHYVITGGGGAPLYDVATPAGGITQKVVSTEHFVTVSVDGATARVEAIAVDGTKLDSFEFSASPQK